MKEYEISMPVGGICYTDDEYPDSGDFDGASEWDEEEGVGDFTGEFRKRIFANSEEEARELFVDAYEHADSGELEDMSYDDLNIEITVVRENVKEGHRENDDHERI